MNSPAERYLALGRKAGLLLTGEDVCRAAAGQGRVRLMLLAADASPNAQKRAHDAMEGRRAPLRTLPWNKEELSALLGRRGCSMVCFTDLALAEHFAKAMAEGLPEWQETAELLSQREEKARRRKGVKRRKPDPIENRRM